MDIASLDGIGTGRAKLLRGAGINTVDDLVKRYPRDYDDRSRIVTIGEAVADASASGGIMYTICGTIAAEGENINFRPGSPVITKVLLQDETGTLVLVWFGQPYLKKVFRKNDAYYFTGRIVESYAGRMQMESPDYEKVPAKDVSKGAEVSDEAEALGESLSAGRILPVYTLPKGISQKMFPSG